MTTEERYYTTKLYLDKLSCGIDPISGEEFPEDEVLNNVLLCRAFSFASSVLEEVIRNGCKVGKKTPTMDFRITDEQRRNIVISENAVTVSVIVSRINKVLDEGVKCIATPRVTQWLEMQGLLSSVDMGDGRRNRIATDEGEKLGIETVETEFQGRTIKKNLYNLNAQAFIIANLSEIMDTTSAQLKFEPILEDKASLVDNVEENLVKEEKVSVKASKSKKPAKKK